MRKLTDLNADVLAAKQLGEVESLTFISNNKFEVEAFLTKPIGMTATTSSNSGFAISGIRDGRQRVADCGISATKEVKQSCENDENY